MVLEQTNYGSPRQEGKAIKAIIVKCERCGQALNIKKTEQENGVTILETSPCPICSIEFYNSGYNEGYDQKTKENWGAT